MERPVSCRGTPKFQCIFAGYLTEFDFLEEQETGGALGLVARPKNLGALLGRRLRRRRRLAFLLRPRPPPPPPPSRTFSAQNILPEKERLSVIPHIFIKSCASRVLF